MGTRRALTPQFQRITTEEHDKLIKTATHVEVNDPGSPSARTFKEDWKRGISPGRKHTQTIKRQIRVPVEQEVEVPVYKKEVEHRVERKVIKGTRMVPVKKYKDITETVLETREETVRGFREKWVKQVEPTWEVVKRQVPVQRTRRVAYTDYVSEPYEKVVEVPVERVTKKKGTRIDKHVGTKLIEVEEDHHYELKPVYVAKGETRMQENGYEHHGKTVHAASRPGGKTASRSRSSPPAATLQPFDPPPRERLGLLDGTRYNNTPRR